MTGAVWSGVDPELRAIVERVCTPKERDALELHMLGNGYKRIGRILGISRDAARARLDSARDKINKELANAGATVL